MKGKLIVLSGPSGVGKGTIIRKVLKSDPSLVLSVSATTRSIRSGETDGVNYHFISLSSFKELIDKGELLEYAVVYDNMYGTLRSKTMAQLQEGHDVILEIDTVGAMNIKSIFPSALTIFLTPPDIDTLSRRLKGRGTETEEMFRKRVEAADLELENSHKYDYVVQNDDAERCAQQVIEIIKANKVNNKSNR